MTQEKTFKELFPELEWNWEFIDGGKKKISAVRTEDIKKSCLSKQRVKEAIGKLKIAYPYSYGTMQCIMVDKLKKELGLE